MPKLTKRVVDTLAPTPGASETFAWDSQLKGFGVRLMPSGTGSYILKYRNHEGRQRKLALARIGSITPEEARAIALQRLAEVNRGDDPSADRKAVRKAITMAELCDLYLEDAADRIKASTLAMDRSRITVHVKPLIGSRKVVGLTSEDLEQLQAEIAAGKTATPRNGRGGATTGGKGVASRTLGMVGTILEFARRKKIIKDNPARGIQRLPEGKQTRFLNEAEISRLGAALSDYESSGTNPVGIAVIRFLLLTGCRRMEALSLPLAWVDHGARCIRFEDSKGISAKDVGRRVELRAIGKPALSLVATLQRLGDSPWAFPSGRGGGHQVGIPVLLAQVCRAAQLTGVTVHVLRHTFAAVAAGMGFSELTIAGLLGHKVAGVTARYAHVPDSSLVAAADEIAEQISKLLSSQPER